MEYEVDSDIKVRGLEKKQKNLEKRLRQLEIQERIKTVQTTALLRSTRIWEESWRDLLSLKLQQKQQVTTGMKNSENNIIINDEIL